MCLLLHEKNYHILKQISKFLIIKILVCFCALNFLQTFLYLIFMCLEYFVYIYICKYVFYRGQQRRIAILVKYGTKKKMANFKRRRTALHNDTVS